MSRIRVPSLLLECVMLQFYGCGEAHCSKTYCVVVVLEVVETSLPNSWWWDGQLWPYQESDNLSKYEERRLRLGSESDKVLLQWFWFSANWVLLLTGDMKYCQDVTVQVPCIMHIAKQNHFFCNCRIEHWKGFWMTSGMCAGISPPARRPDHHFAKELEQLLRNLSINATYRKLPEKIQVSCQASAHTRTIKIWLSTFPRQGSGVVFGVEEWERHSKLVSTGLVRLEGALWHTS